MISVSVARNDRLQGAILDFDLRVETWIPWRRRRSGVVWGPISMLVDGLKGDDPVIAIASPRPDFDGALMEFLIGLLSVSLKPADEADWLKMWNSPPPPAAFQAALDALPDAFVLDAEKGPRFLQDFTPSELTDCDVLACDRLAMDSPGEQGVKLNKTLFVKPGRFAQLSRPSAAIALLTLQTYAPSGGQGNRTSMRGGGPLTTLADPRKGTHGVHADEQPLWELLWINAETEDQCRNRAPSGGASAPERVFPWLAATYTSDDKKPAVTPARANVMQAYFGMPRRISLLFSKEGVCDLTGRSDECVVTGFRMRNYGVEYTGWIHPLSPHYLDKDTVWRPVHPQPGGVTWKDWPDMTLSRLDGSREPAGCVRVAQKRAKRLDLPELRLCVFGYDMDNMKARAWISTVQPLLVTDNERTEDLEWLNLLAVSLVNATRLASAALNFAIKTAWYPRPEDAGADAVVARQELWARSEALFFNSLRTALKAGLTNESVTAARRDFLAPLRDITMALLEAEASTQSAPVTAIRRHVSARYALSGTFNGFGKMGNEIFTALAHEPPIAATGIKKGAAKKPINKKKGAAT
jgi:CRISPR system Cascade subunit CasA